MQRRRTFRSLLAAFLAWTAMAVAAESPFRDADTLSGLAWTHSHTALPGLAEPGLLASR